MVNPTQEHIEIAGIKDGIILLKNGGYRLIMSVSTVNFALKNEEEQNSIIFQYQSFLNSLHFPVQIVMQSRKLDLTNYLNKVSKIKDNTENELLKLQMEDYIDYVKQLINVANIMKKNFYVIVEYLPISLTGPSFLDKLFNRSNTPSEIRISETEFAKYKSALIERASTVANGLGTMGLRCVQLTTEEIIELFYRIYNPEIAAKEQITDAEALTAPIIESESERTSTSEDMHKEVAKEESLIDNAAVVEEKQKVEQKQKEVVRTASQTQGEQTPITSAPTPEPQNSDPSTQNINSNPAPDTIVASQAAVQEAPQPQPQSLQVSDNINQPQPNQNNQ